jgi:hypothetical protein
MAKIFFQILEKLPTKLIVWLGNKHPEIFFRNERIVRHIYSPHNFNSNTRKLKANFLQFAFNSETNEYELSCNRFEVESLRHCRAIGKINARPPKHEYYGFACSSVKLITSYANYSLFYSPLQNKGLFNYSHSDVYGRGSSLIAEGEARTAKINLEREIFLKAWSTYIDAENLIQKMFITPPQP